MHDLSSCKTQPTKQPVSQQLAHQVLLEYCTDMAGRPRSAHRLWSPPLQVLDPDPATQLAFTAKFVCHDLKTGLGNPMRVLNVCDWHAPALDSMSPSLLSSKHRCQLLRHYSIGSAAGSAHDAVTARGCMQPAHSAVTSSPSRHASRRRCCVALGRQPSV